MLPIIDHVRAVARECRPGPMPHVATMCPSILGYGGRSTSLSQSGLAARPWPWSGRSETASLHQHWHVPTTWSEGSQRPWSPHSHDLGGSRCAFRSFAGHRTTYASYTVGYARSRAYEQLSSALVCVDSVWGVCVRIIDLSPHYSSTDYEIPGETRSRTPFTPSVHAGRSPTTCVVRW